MFRFASLRLLHLPFYRSLGREKELLNIQKEGLVRRARDELRRTNSAGFLRFSEVLVVAWVAWGVVVQAGFCWAFLVKSTSCHVLSNCACVLSLGRERVHCDSCADVGLRGRQGLSLFRPPQKKAFLLCLKAKKNQENPK